MENIKERVDRKWFGVLLLTSLVCCLFLSLTFDVLVEYQIIIFTVLIIACILFSIYTIAAVRLSSSIEQRPSKAIIVITTSIFAATGLLYCYHHGAFYGRRIIDATFLDERSSMHLSLYADGHYIVNSDWMFGTEDFSGTYKMSENDIILDEYSSGNKFIPKYLLRHRNKIYFFNDKQVQLRDTSFFYFKINNTD